MAKITHITLGEMVRDTISNTQGMLTHLMIAMGGQKEYLYQPSGLNPETGTPVDRIFVVEPRIKGGNFEEIDAPLELLGTYAEDIATGFKGKITSLIYHLNGCLHVEIKPEGVLKKTGATISAQEFDIRRVKGDMIEPLKGKKLKESTILTPSPMEMPRQRNH